jgi:SAM-dependent methyltransferase
MNPTAAETFRETRRSHWDALARGVQQSRSLGGYYHKRLHRVYALLVAPGQRVLELGCGRGDLLAAVHPAHGVGVDFSSEMIAQARERHGHRANLRFVEADAHEIDFGDEKFDVVILSDLVNDLWDVQAVLERVRTVCTPRTRVILNFFSRLWQPPLTLARKMGLADPVLEQNWLATEDVQNLLTLAGFEQVRHWPEILWPLRTPGIDAFFNKFLARLPVLKLAALQNMMVARPMPAHSPGGGNKPIVSVIVPARNEAGNIPAVFVRTPEMAGGTEFIFVEGHSSDDTYAAIERAIAANPQRKAKLFRQSGKGKGDAVRLGFAEASGDILMILDADLTVPPEDLPRFVDALVAGKAEFVNGVRLVYPMEKQSMQFLNQIANKVFGLTFSWLLGQPVRDTLCGTKALHRSDYNLIAANRAYFGDFDPFGDFDLLFGAAKLNLKIVDLPIRYRERTYGTTNIQRFSHGWLLLGMTLVAARRLKFT